jgi:hypothetical protein
MLESDVKFKINIEKEWWKISSEWYVQSYLLQIILNQKSIISLLKWNFQQIFSRFNIFYNKMNDLINISNINFDHFKRVLFDVFIHKNF